MNELAWKAGAGVLAVVLLLAMGAAGGFWLAGRHYDPLLADAQSKAEASAGQLAGCTTTRDNLQASVAQQNQALIDLQRQAAQVAERAQAAQASAEQKAQSAEQRAQQILAERPAPGADACSAARNAFDSELKKERGE